MRTRVFPGLGVPLAIFLAGIVAVIGHSALSWAVLVAGFFLAWTGAERSRGRRGVPQQPALSLALGVLYIGIAGLCLIELRHAEPAVVHGDFTMLLEDDPRVYAFTRRLGDTELLVVANFGGEAASAAGIPAAERWEQAELLIANVQERDRAPFLQLAPWEARAYRLSGRPRA